MTKELNKALDALYLVVDESVAKDVRAKVEAAIAPLQEVAQWAQATLTALNVGDVAKESPLHLKLREVMIAYRAKTTDENGNPK
jgi:hypothetical protein